MPSLSVELTPGDERLDNETRTRLQAVSTPGDTEEAIRKGTLAFRAFAMAEMKKRLAYTKELNPLVLDSMLNEIWNIFLPSFHRVTVPYLVGAYAEGFAKARAGSVPPEVLNALAEQYATRMGNYFHQTSKEALIQGFNKYVNRKMPARAAAERVLDAYGLTPRQMGGYVANVQFDAKIESSIATKAKKKVQDYIGKSIQQRLDVFSRQETHNLDQQAKQVAWNYLVENGSVPEASEKVWITAKDERVCPQCGPMHGKRVPVQERFENGLYVPGVHPNCRCEAKLTVVPISIGKAADWEEHEHPRGPKGRFVRKPSEGPAPSEGPQRQRTQQRRTAPPVAEADREDLTNLQSFLDSAVSTPEEDSLPTLSLEDIAVPVEEKTETVRPSYGRPQYQRTVRPDYRAPRPDYSTKKETARPDYSAAQSTPALPDYSTAPVEGTIAPDYRGGGKPSKGSPPKYSPPTPEEPITPKGVSEGYGVLDLERLNGRPLYAVSTPADAMMFGNASEPRLVLQSDRRFTSNLDDAVARAATQRNKKIYKEWAKRTGAGAFPFKYRDRKNKFHSDVWVHVDPADFEEVVEITAEQAQDPYDPEGAAGLPDKFIDVDLVDSDGNILENKTKVRASEIIREARLEPDDFAYAVFRMRKGHNHPSRGVTHLTPLHGYEEGATSGEYEVSTHPEWEETPAAEQVQIFEIEPFDPYYGPDWMNEG